MQIGVGYASRDFCDGQSLASPGRWAPDDRVFPETERWAETVKLFRAFADTFTSTRLLVEFSVGHIKKSPFSKESIAELEGAVIGLAKSYGLELRRGTDDRSDVPIDSRFMQILLGLAGDPEVSLGTFAPGVRVGPGARLPRLPALYKAKRRWRLPEQTDPLEYLEQHLCPESIWRNNYASLPPLEEQVLEVLHEQASRGQIIMLPERAARAKFPSLVIASLGANRKEKPTGRSLHEYFSMAQTGWK